MAISQEQLAQASGLSRATIQRVESGQVVPDVETAQSLASVFKVDAVRIRRDAGLASRVNRLATITNERDPTTAELRTLPPQVRKVFSDYVAARSECEAVVRAIKEEGERSSAAHRERMAAMSRCTVLAKEVGASPADLELRSAYRESLALLAGMPRESPDAGVALADRAQKASGDAADKGLALGRLLLQFV